MRSLARPAAIALSFGAGPGEQGFDAPEFLDEPLFLVHIDVINASGWLAATPFLPSTRKDQIAVHPQAPVAHRSPLSNQELPA
jgi:hypothetical protein